MEKIWKAMRFAPPTATVIAAAISTVPTKLTRNSRRRGPHCRIRTGENCVVPIEQTALSARSAL